MNTVNNAWGYLYEYPDEMIQLIMNIINLME